MCCLRTVWTRLIHLSLASLTAAILLLIPASTAPGAPSASPGTSDVVYRVGWLENPDTLNPFMSLVTSTYVLYHLNYDYLVGFDAATLEPRPELATSWSASEDGTTWTFTTRSGVTWQDGTPFTARDVAFTLNYIVRGGLPGVGAYADGIVGARATNDQTVVVKTRAPKADMLDMIIPILPEHVWSKVSPKAAATAFENPTPVVGTGPFQIVDFKSGKYVELQANESYWGGRPSLDRLIFQVYTNPVSMISDLRTGSIDGAVGVPAALFSQIDGPDLEANRGVSWTWTELAFNCSDSPASKGNPVLRDTAFRRALQYAIDRQRIVDVAFGGYASTGSTMVVPYVPYDYHWQPRSAEAYTYNPQEAGALLDAAGYRDTDGDGRRETQGGASLSLGLMAPTSSSPAQTAARQIAGWLREVGIKTTLTVVEDSAMLAAIYNFEGSMPAPDYDMAVSYWTNDVDPDPILKVFTADNIGMWNDVYWVNPRYEAARLKQSQTIDAEARRPLVHSCQQIAYQQSPFVVLAYPELLEAYRSRDWTGYVVTPSDTEGTTGSVLYSWNNIDTYRSLAPAATAAEATSRAPLYVVLLAAGLVVAVLVTVLARRGRRTEV